MPVSASNSSSLLELPLPLYITLPLNSPSLLTQTIKMSILTNRYPPYPSGMGPRRIIDSGGYPITRSLSPYDRDSRYLIERPELISRTRSYHNCHCGIPISNQGDHLCRSCHLITHAANQVLNIRGGDHCDCKSCNLALEDEERELEVLDRYGYYSTGSVNPITQFLFLQLVAIARTSFLIILLEATSAAPAVAETVPWTADRSVFLSFPDERSPITLHGNQHTSAAIQCARLWFVRRCSRRVPGLLLHRTKAQHVRMSADHHMIEFREGFYRD